MMDPSRLSHGRPIAQVAFLVDDLEPAAQHWYERCGAGPFFVRHHVPMRRVVHRGAAGVFDHSRAVGQWGPIMVELVQYHDLQPESLRRRMVGTGVGAINHVAWFVDDLDAECQRLKALGADEVMRADTGSLELAFYDGFDGLGPIVELYERNPYVLGVYDLCRTAAEGWDGTDPVRVQV